MFIIVICCALTLFSVSYKVNAETTYEKLTSVSDIDETARYVLGIDGTGFHYSGTSSWGKIALPDKQTPYYYTLKKVDSEADTFTACTSINDIVNYLTVPTSNTFTMSTSSTTLKMGTAQDDSATICNASTATRHIRINGTSGLRSYESATGKIAYFYKVVSSTVISPIAQTTGFSIVNNTLTINEVTDATRYRVGFFTNEDDTEPSFTLETTTNTITIKDIPQDIEYIVKVKTLASSNYTDSAYFSTSTPTKFTNTLVSQYTVAKIKTELPNQTEGPWVYYEVTAKISSIDNTSNSQLKIVDNLSDETYLTVLGIADFNVADYCIGDTLTLKGYINNSQFKGTVVLNHTVDYLERFSVLETKNSLKFGYTTSTTTQLVDCYVKVTSNLEDWTGSYLIVYEDGLTGYVFNGADAANGYVSATINNNIIYSSPDLNKCLVNIAKSDDNYSIKLSDTCENNADKFISGTSGSNKLNFNDTAQYSTIAYETNSVKITSNTSVFAFNSANNQMRFRFYSSSQKSVQLYKLSNVNTPVTTYTDVTMSLRFGTKITKELFDNLNTQATTEGKTIEFGVAYTKAEPFDQHIGITPVRVNVNGEEDANGEYYQFALVATNIADTNWATKINAKCYVKIGTDYYYMIEKNVSVKDVASAYLADGNVDAYEGVLTYIKNYN